MHVISKKRLREFFDAHKDSESSLSSWYAIVKKANWKSLVDVKSVYPTADLVGRYTVFNIGGNKYRLVARVRYETQTVFVIRIMTHKEYDLGKWKE